MHKEPFNFVLLINSELCRQNYLHKKAQTLFSDDVEYQDPLLIFSRFFILGKKKKKDIFEKTPKEV